MKVSQALAFAATLLQAAQQAMEEGRDTLRNEDLQTFRNADDSARDDLEAAIAAARNIVPARDE